MSEKHGHKPFEGHMHDYLAHIKAVEEDLEYYRAKRFEPRIFYLLRRGVVTFYDLLKVGSALKRKITSSRSLSRREGTSKRACVIWKSGLTSMSKALPWFPRAPSKAWTW